MGEETQMDETGSLLESYHVVFDSQSQHAGDSMPVGGGDVALNVWVEENDLLFYIGKSGTFDENYHLLKLGRVRLRWDPNPFVQAESFRQELNLGHGAIGIVAEDTKGLLLRVEVWVEVARPVIHIEAQSRAPRKLLVQYESWRTVPFEVPQGRWRHGSMSTIGYPGKVIIEPDEIAFVDGSVRFVHQNRNDRLIFDKLLDQQGLGAVVEKLWNPQRNLTFGGLLTGEELEPDGEGEGEYAGTKYRAWRLQSRAGRRTHRLQVALFTDASDSLEQWSRSLAQIALDPTPLSQRKRDTEKWWQQFWQRSYIRIRPDTPDSSDPAWQVGRNYQLFRFMLALNAYGTSPTKFNGGQLTTDPVWVDASLAGATPDFRMWGGGTATAQNQRLVYWPMLKSGDFDMMPSQFDFYRRALANAELRTEVYWGHEGASFCEQIEPLGLPNGYTWGWLNSDDPLHRRTPYSDPTEQVSPWIRYHYVNQLEFAWMILKYREYSGLDIAPYWPFIQSALRFIDEHYQYRHGLNTGRRLNAQGKLVLFPSTAAETYKDATNPSDLIAALTAVVREVLKLPSSLVGSEARKHYEELKDRIPDLPKRTIQGRSTIAPADFWSEIINVEIPQLYPVFPYDLYGVGRPNFQEAVDTWQYGVDTQAQKDTKSWHQDNIFCARLRLIDEAQAYTIKKLQDGPRRFPAFWGPGHDWVPDHNWGGSGMIGLQEMIMQVDQETIYLLPAWPRAWDVDFRLWAPQRTMVEGQVRGGQLTRLAVDPPERAKDVVNLLQPG